MQYLPAMHDAHACFSGVPNCFLIEPVKYLFFSIKKWILILRLDQEGEHLHQLFNNLGKSSK